jgi:hypothetical protein
MSDIFLRLLTFRPRLISQQGFRKLINKTLALKTQSICVDGEVPVSPPKTELQKLETNE